MTLGMAHEKFSLSEESTHEQIQGENDYHFFREPWYCSQRILTSRKTVNHAIYKDVLE
jgi:hypothetical protein